MEQEYALDQCANCQESRVKIVIGANDRTNKCMLAAV